MSTKSNIEWTDVTWNPTTGCDPVSPGCDNCYARPMSNRCRAMGLKKYRNRFVLTLHSDTLRDPLRLKRPRRIFVNSMSDLFHAKVPLNFIQQVFGTMEAAHWHQFQILTKRSGRLLQLDQALDWRANIWMGVSVENSDYTFRIDHLRKTAAAIKFLSLEPLLGPLTDLNLNGIDWVIVGGESGHGARPMDPAWATSIRNQCMTAGIPCFVSRWAQSGRGSAN